MLFEGPQEIPIIESIIRVILNLNIMNTATPYLSDLPVVIALLYSIMDYINLEHFFCNAFKSQNMRLEKNGAISWMLSPG